MTSPQRKDPKGWDQCIIDGVILPGQSKIKGLVRERDVEQKKVPGAHGEDLDIKGVQSPAFTIETRLWTDEQYQESVQVFQKLDPIPGKEKAKVHSIDSAPLRARNIGYIVITKVEGPEQDGEYTIWKTTVRGRSKPNSNNVGLGPPAGQTCQQLQQEYALRRDEYLKAKYKAQGVIADLRNQQQAAAAGPGTDDARALQFEKLIRQIESELDMRVLQIRAVGAKMIEKGCPNVPPDVAGF